MTVNLGSIEVTLSIKYSPHLLEPPSSTPLQHKPVFCVLIGDVARLELSLLFLQSKFTILVCCER